MLVENEMGVLSRTFTLEAKGEKTIIDLARGIVFKLIVSKFNRLKRSMRPEEEEDTTNNTAPYHIPHEKYCCLNDADITRQIKIRGKNVVKQQ